MAYQPPFTLTHHMTTLVANIAELVGEWRTQHQGELIPALRRGNRIRTIQASLAVEQNTLTVEQVTAVLDGKTVLGQAREIQEVHNAFAAYEAMHDWQPHCLQDLLRAHGLLMRALVEDAGQLRRADAGIYRGEQLIHAAPPVSQLSRLMHDLLYWLEHTEVHPLIASAAFHYDFEFIHPFSDGNGRMGRLWQTLILSQWQPLLAYLPVETVIKNRQQDYYRLLREADASSDCTGFIEFLLQSIESSLREAVESENTPVEAPVNTPVEPLLDDKMKTPAHILHVLQQQPELTLAEVAQVIGRSPRAVERAVAKLKLEGKLSFQGPKKGGRWLVL